MKRLVVIPSIRDFPTEYLLPLKDLDIMIIDDTPAKEGQERLIPKPYWHNGIWLVVPRNKRASLIGTSFNEIIPTASPSCKNVGLVYAYKNNYDQVILLDDDCDVRATESYVEMIPVGKKVNALTFAGYKWFNPLGMIERPDLFSRGFPYVHRGIDPMMFVQKRGNEAKYGPVVSSFNEGLWYGTPDINGIDKYGMEFKDYQISSPCFPAYVHVLDQTLVPISIMNIQMETKLIPAFFQPPDYHCYGNFYIKRHDDVWAGMFLKTCMGYMGDKFTVGEPMIRHVKTPDSFGEAHKETMTNAVQPYLERVLRNASDKLNKYELDTYPEVAEKLCECAYAVLEILYPEIPKMAYDILRKYFVQADEWATLFKEQ